MRAFFKGKAFAGILFERAKINYANNPARFFSFYLLPLLLLCIGRSYLFYKEQPVTDNIGINEELLFSCLITIVILFFQLIKTNEGKKVIEKKLATSQIRFETIYNSGIAGLLFTRLDGHIIQANDHFLEMIGYSKEELEDGSINWKTLTPETTRKPLQLLSGS